MTPKTSGLPIYTDNTVKTTIKCVYIYCVVNSIRGKVTCVAAQQAASAGFGAMKDDILSHFG